MSLKLSLFTEAMSFPPHSSFDLTLFSDIVGAYIYRACAFLRHGGVAAAAERHGGSLPREHAVEKGFDLVLQAIHIEKVARLKRYYSKTRDNLYTDSKPLWYR
jgi:hypothetical protein